MAHIAPSLPPLDVTRAPEGGAVGPVQTGWRLAFREFAKNRLAVIGLAILAFYVLFCFGGPLFYHANLLNTDLTAVNLPPGPGHPLGTDPLGFDVLGQLMKGGQASLEVGFFAAAIGIGIGALWGAISGLLGGIADSVMMRVVDVFLSVPFLFVVLIVAVRYGASVLSLSLIIGGFTWLVPARLVRGEVLTLRVRDFVSAARAAGSGRWRLINRLRPALPDRRLGRHALRRDRVPAGRVLVADLSGWREHHPRGDGVQPHRRRTARLAGRAAAPPLSPAADAPRDRHFTH